MEQTILSVVSDDVPLPRSGHRIVADEGNLYVIGGYVQFPDRLLVKGEVWRYNLISNRWQQLHFRNHSFHLAASHAACALGHTVVIHGGTGTNFGKFIDNSLSVLDLRGLTFCALSCAPKDGISSNIPLPTYGHTLTFVVVDDEPYFYKIGGAMGVTYTMNVYRYSLHDKVWERVYHDGSSSTVHPEARYRHDTVLYENKLYLLAGGNELETHPIWPMPVFDLKTNRWSTVEFSGTRPPLLRYQSSALVDHDVYVVGGITDNYQVINPNIYRLDLKRRVCHLVARQESPAYFHDVTYLPHLDELYSFGGTNCVDPVTRTNQLHRFRLHRRPLALVELAWDRVIDLLTSPFLFLAAIRRYIIDVTADVATRPDSVDSIARVLDTIRTVLSSSFESRLRTTVPVFGEALRCPRKPHALAGFHPSFSLISQTAFRVSAVVLLILNGPMLGLHTCESVHTFTDLLDALEQTTSGGKHVLPRLMQHLAQMVLSRERGQSDQENQSSDAATDEETAARSHRVQHFQTYIEALFAPNASAANLDTRLPLSNALDTFFYTALFYLLHVPDHLIRRLPDGADYLRYVQCIENLLSQHETDGPA